MNRQRGSGAQTQIFTWLFAWGFVWFFVACGNATPMPIPTTTPRPSPTPSPTPVPIQYAIIGKARDAYWQQAERGAQLAERELRLPPGSVVFYAPDKEDAGAQIIAFDEFVAQRVRGIAIAPSEPRALELSIQRARASGIWVITFDTDAPNSQRNLFVGTPQTLIGQEAAHALLALIGDRSGKIAIGSTRLDDVANARIAAFKNTLNPNKKLSVPDAVHDKQDIALASQNAKNALATHKDLVGAFGVYGYNSLAWCRIISEAGRSEQLLVVGFDVTPETVDCLKSGALDVLLATRPYEQGQRSINILDLLNRKGLLNALQEFGFDQSTPQANWIVRVDLDLITRDGKVGLSLLGYAGKLDGLGVPREWKP